MGIANATAVLCRPPTCKIMFATNLRCGGAVFSAEEIHSGGKSYHKKCTTCATCEKQLTFNTVFDGEDKVSQEFRNELRSCPLGLPQEIGQYI